MRALRPAAVTLVIGDRGLGGASAWGLQANVLPPRSLMSLGSRLACVPPPRCPAGVWPQLAPVLGSWRMSAPLPLCGRSSLDGGLSGGAPWLPETSFRDLVIHKNGRTQ